MLQYKQSWSSSGGHGGGAFLSALMAVFWRKMAPFAQRHHVHTWGDIRSKKSAEMMKKIASLGTLLANTCKKRSASSWNANGSGFKRTLFDRQFIIESTFLKKE